MKRRTSSLRPYLIGAFILQLLAVLGFYFEKALTGYGAVYLPLKSPVQELLIPVFAFIFCMAGLYMTRIAKQANSGADYSGYRILFAMGAIITAITTGKVMFTCLSQVPHFHGALPFSYLIVGGVASILLPCIFAFAFMKK